MQRPKLLILDEPTSVLTPQEAEQLFATLTRLRWVLAPTYLAGAAAVVVMSDTKARELGLTPLARVVSTGVSGLSPEIMGYGPV